MSRRKMSRQVPALNDRFVNYWTWNGMLHSYTTLKKESAVYQDEHRLKYLRRQIIWHFFKNFFFFPLWLLSLLVPSYMNGEVTVWTNLRTLWHTLTSREFRPLRMAVLMQFVFLYALGHLGYIVFHNYAIPTYAATYTWIQNSWSGGVSSTTALHPGDRNGWDKYASASSTITAGATVSLSPESVSKVYTNTTDFADGTLTSTTISGSGDAAKLALYGEVEEINSWDTPVASAPGTIGNGSYMIRNGSDDHVYVLQGNGTGFYRYVISSNSWTTLAPVISNVNIGSQMIRNGSDDHIYVLQGGGGAGFYRYSISGNSWTLRASVPGTVGSFGEKMIRNGSDDHIYVLQGGGGAGFYRYSISGNSWITLTAVPGSVGDGVQIIRNGSEDYIYVLNGGDSTNFYRYSISGNSWETLAVVPGMMNIGNTLLRDGADDYIYVVQGWRGTGFYRYSISGNSWTTLASIPGATQTGSTSLRNGSDDFIYVLRGNNSANLYRYSISGNSWTTLASTPETVSNGGFMIANASFTEFFALRGWSANTFFKYSISSNSWTGNKLSVLSDTPAAMSQGAHLVRNGEDNYVYTVRGTGANNFYRYSISGNSWTALTTPPQKLVSGRNGILHDGGDYIYALRADFTTDFYRYSISGNSWTTLASASTANTGSVIRHVGNFIYHFRHNTAGFYRYSISGNSWTTLPDYPGGLMGDGVDAVYDGSDTFYVQRGNGNGSFAKYIISQNSWSVLTTSTISVGAGGSLHYYPGEDYIYSFGGSSGTSFARYSISGNSWSTLTSVPNTVTAGTAVVRQGNSDYIYVLRGSNTGSFYRYSISGNSWTTLTSVPQNATLGSSLLSSDTGEIYALLGGNAYFFRYTTSRTTYSTPGTYTSPVFDTTGHTGFTTLSYTSSTPGNTTLTIDARAGDTATPDGSWTSWQTGISNGGDISALGTRRYIQYRANLSTSNTARTPELADLTLQYGRYTSGSLVSTPYNANDASNVVGSISWSESETPGTSVTFQVRTSPNNATWTDWTGPDGTSATVFTDSTGAQDMPAIFNDSQDDQWMQYRMTLTGSGASTPTVSDVTVTYVVNAPPDIAIVTSTPMVQSSAGVVALSYLVRDIDTSVGVTPGTVDIDLQYCTSNCASVGNEVWETAASSSLTGTYGEAISIQAEDYTEYSLIWDPTISLPGHYNGTDFKIRLRANDSEAANNYGYDESNTFTLDTADPVVSMSIDGRNDAPYNLTLAVTDDTTAGLEMKLSNNSDLSPDGLNPGSGTWVSYLTTSTWDFPLGGTTVYYQVRDAYGNVSADGAVSQAQTPEVPDSIVYRDVSNSETEEWREFIAWGVVPLPGPGFDEYTLWRSTDGGVTYTELTTQADRLINYYIDDNLSNETTYYYRVSVTDSDGNISNYSSVASDRPDGQGGSDETVPTISNVTSTALGTDTVTITWDTDELSDSTVDYMTDTGGDFSNAESIGLTAMVDSAGGLGQHTVTLSGLTPATTYYYRVRSEDPQSNEGVSTEDPDGYTFTTLAGPSLTDVAVSRISNTDATITWTTDQSSDSYVYYSTSTDFSSPTLVGLANNTFEHEITLGSLSLGTTYYFYVQSGVGVAKNVVLGEIQYYTFTTTNDVTAPVLTFDSETDVTVSDESISLSWVTDEIATSTVEYGTSNEYGTTVINANLNTNHSFTLNNLLPGTLYYLRIRSTDAHGNRSGATEFTATTIDTADYVAPVISNVNASVVTDNDALIVWDTDENATGQVHYGTASTLYTDSSDLVSTYNRAHAITLSNLNTSTLYYYVVVSADSSGNSTTSSEYTFTTLEALSEESEVELREQAAAEAARAEGILEGTSSRRGGGGGASVDRTAPVVSNLSITNISDSGATISWSATEASVGIVEFGLSTTYAKSTLNVPLSLVEEHVVTLTDLDPETTYFISATALDNSFNRSTALVDSFTTLAEGEVPSEEDPLVSPEDTATLPREETEKIFTESLQRAGEILRVMSTEVGVGALESNLSEQALLIQELASLLPVPIISGSPQVEVGTTFANISWTTDKPSNSLVSYAPESVYALTGEYEQTVGDFDTMVVSHSVSLRGLLPGTVYHYRLSSRTITGSETNSRDFIFTTSDEVSEITSYRTTIASPAQTSFTWVTTVPTDSVITYIPYQNGVPNIAAKKSVRNNIFTTQHTLDISDFESGVLYDIELSGTDVGGNIVSKLIQGYSTDGQDLPPVISQIKTENALLPGGKERVQTIISWNTNELSTSRVYYRKGFASDDTPFTDSTLLDTEYVRKHVVVISNFESGQVYQFAVESTDSGGNTAVSKTITILTPRKEESVFQVIMSNVEDIFSWAGKIRR